MDTHDILLSTSLFYCFSWLRFTISDSLLRYSSSPIPFKTIVQHTIFTATIYVCFSGFTKIPVLESSLGLVYSLFFRTRWRSWKSDCLVGIPTCVSRFIKVEQSKEGGNVMLLFFHSLLLFAVHQHFFVRYPVNDVRSSL